MLEEYEVDKLDIFGAIPGILESYKEKHGHKPDVICISSEYGEMVARAISARLFIAVMTFDSLEPEIVKLDMLPEGYWDE